MKFQGQVRGKEQAGIMGPEEHCEIW